MKFHNDCFISCQEVRENALHFLKLEMLPKSGVRSINGEIDLRNEMIQKEYTNHQNKFCVALTLSHVLQSALYTGSSDYKFNKMLSYRRETALHGAL